MRNLPRLPEGANADEKIRIIYDWLYEWSKTNKSFAEQGFASGENTNSVLASETSGEKVE